MFDDFGGGSVALGGAQTRAISYDYDGLSRLTGATESPGTTYAYSYDDVGNRTGVWVGGTRTVTQTFNAANQVVGWSYDAVGNLTSDGTTTYTWDALNRMTEAGGATYQYNGDGVLVATTALSTTTRYTQDLAAPLTQVLGDGSARYVYGHERLFSQAGSARTWYGADALGSVRQTLSDTGLPQSALFYDPWGNVESGTVPTFGFTGELQQGGGVYLRARWYNPTTGMFPGHRWRTDESFDDQPLSHHVYQYAYDNPINYIDPDGRFGRPAKTGDGGSVGSECSSSTISLEMPAYPLGSIDEKALVRCMRFDILKYAYRHARSEFGFTPHVTAALIGAIIMMETGSKDPQDLYWNWPGSRIANRLLPGIQNRSLGIANIRPSVAIEILCGTIPLGIIRPDGTEEVMTADLHLSYITKKSYLGDYDRNIAAAKRGYDISDRFIQQIDYPRITGLLDNTEFAIDLLGANIERGILRAHRKGIKPSMFNLATWHNCGVQGAGAINSCQKQQDVIGYGRLVSNTLVDVAANLLGISAPPSDLKYNVSQDSELDEEQFVK